MTQPYCIWIEWVFASQAMPLHIHTHVRQCETEIERKTGELFKSENEMQCGIRFNILFSHPQKILN